MINDKIKLLIVDDSPTLTNVMAEYFTENGYDVASSDGSNALELLNQNEYNVVITDLKLSTINGHQIIKYIREKSSLAEIIVITAYASIDSTIEAIRTSVFDYIEKPFSFEQIERIVKNAALKNKINLENKKHLYQLSEQNERLENRIKELINDLEDTTLKDSLTGLYNYKYFVNILTMEISRAIRYKRQLTIALIEICNYKEYCKTFGAEASNDALIKLAKVIQNNSRTCDIAIRYSEFVFGLILPETNAEQTKRLIVRFANIIKELDFNKKEGTEPPLLSINAGIVTCPDHGDNFDSLIEATQVALIAANKEPNNPIRIFVN